MGNEMFVLCFEMAEIVVSNLTDAQKLDIGTEVVGIQYTEYLCGRPEYSIQIVEY